MVEQAIVINLHPPSKLRQFLEALHIKEVAPEHLCYTPEDFALLCQKYPDLLGDTREFEMGLGGNCQSWRGQKGWWKDLLK